MYNWPVLVKFQPTKANYLGMICTRQLNVRYENLHLLVKLNLHSVAWCTCLAVCLFTAGIMNFVNGSPCLSWTVVWIMPTVVFLAKQWKDLCFCVFHQWKEWVAKPFCNPQTAVRLGRSQLRQASQQLCQAMHQLLQIHVYQTGLVSWLLDFC